MAFCSSDTALVTVSAAAVLVVAVAMVTVAVAVAVAVAVPYRPGRRGSRRLDEEQEAVVQLAMGAAPRAARSSTLDSGKETMHFHAGRSSASSTVDLY